LVRYFSFLASLLVWERVFVFTSRLFSCLTEVKGESVVRLGRSVIMRKDSNTSIWLMGIIWPTVLMILHRDVWYVSEVSTLLCWFVWADMEPVGGGIATSGRDFFKEEPIF
jgi:hypothetical protein